MQHSIIQDIFKNVIVTPQYNYTTGDLVVYTTSNLWDEVDGEANVTWYD
jgi:beta-mannosidase